MRPSVTLLPCNLYCPLEKISNNDDGLTYFDRHRQRHKITLKASYIPDPISPCLCLALLDAVRIFRHESLYRPRAFAMPAMLAKTSHPCKHSKAKLYSLYTHLFFTLVCMSSSVSVSSFEVHTIPLRANFSSRVSADSKLS